MLWDIVQNEKFITYKNRDINLKVNVYDGGNDRERVFMNYKGYNLTIPMLVWEFGEDLNLASIENVELEGDTPLNQCFIIDKKDEERFLDEMYFFLVDNNMDSMLQEKYKI